MLEVRDQLDELAVVLLAFPGLEDDGVFGLGFDVLFLGVDDYGF